MSNKRISIITSPYVWPVCALTEATTKFCYNGVHLHYSVNSLMFIFVYSGVICLVLIFVIHICCIYWK